MSTAVWTNRMELHSAADTALKAAAEWPVFAHSGRLESTSSRHGGPPLRTPQLGR